MVKTVVGDETQLNVTDDRLTNSGFTCQVGLVIGKLSSSLDRGFVFDLIPTPPNDAGLPPSSLSSSTSAAKRGGGSKSKSQSSSSSSDASSSLSIDADWVSEHARQVSRMLPGGVKVVGVYVWVGEAAFKNSTATLLQTVKGVAEAAPGSETDSDERLLLHVSYSPRRWTCRSCVISSTNLRTCDFKMGKVLNSLQTFRCTYNFELRLPIYRESAPNAQTLSMHLRRGISVIANELKEAKAMIDGNLVVNEEPCTTDGQHEVELLLPFTMNAANEARSQKEVAGLLVFAGTICGFTYSNLKEPISQSIADIKDDIIKSLQSRLDIICDEADEDVDPIGDDGGEASGDTPGKPVSKSALHSVRKTCCMPFPRRVFVPWLSGIFICDYVQPSETLEVLNDHFMELMSMEAPPNTSAILQLEAEPPSLSTKSFWDVTFPGNSVQNSSSDTTKKIDTSSATSSGKSTSPVNYAVMAAIFVLILSILFGFVLVRKS